MPSNSRSSTPDTGAGMRLFRLAMVLFFVGLFAIVGIFAVPLVSDAKPRLALYLASMLCPLGFILGVGSALLSGRRTRL